MSILPFDNLTASTSSSASSQLSSPASSLDHGFLSPSSLSTQQSHHYFRSLGIADDCSGQAASAADDSDESSGKVNVPGLPSAENSSAHQNGGGIISQHGIAGPAGVGSAQNQGDTSGSNVSRISHRSCASTLSHLHSSHPTGRKAQMTSGNHLLNFHYDRAPQSHHRPRAPPPRRLQRKTPYNKDLFLQANYKFVLLQSRDIVSASMDPDKMLQWEDIICVKFLTPFPAQCPICLEDPLCPQITSCGHIFCFPCIMQYLMMGEDDCKTEYYKKCPLCFTLTSSKDLYTIYIENVEQHRVSDAMEFVLLTRQKSSFVVSPKHSNAPNASDQVKDSFSKFIFTSDVELSVREAMSDLDSWLARADSGLVDDLEKLPFVCAAVKQLEQRKRYWNERQGFNVYEAQRSVCTSKVSNTDSGACESPWGSPTNTASDKPEWPGKISPDTLTCTFKLLDDHDGTLASPPEDNKDIHTHYQGTNDGKDKDSYSFYQAADGQLLILHPLNMKCLLHHHRSYDRLPNRIRGKILQLESVTQSEATRRRHRYLSHFSLTTTFHFCEVDLSETLPADSLLPFMDEINNREKQRKRLARKEQRDKLKAEAAGLDFMRNPLNYEQTYCDEPPTFSIDDFEALGSSVATSSSPQSIEERQSFSSVARLGFAAGHDSPALKLEESSPCRTRDGVRDSHGSSGTRSHSSPSFANVISRGKTPEPERQDNPKINEMGKKGKKPSRVLLSTAGGRRY